MAIYNTPHEAMSPLEGEIHKLLTERPSWLIDMEQKLNKIPKLINTISGGKMPSRPIWKPRVITIPLEIDAIPQNQRSRGLVITALTDDCEVDVFLALETVAKNLLTEKPSPVVYADGCSIKISHWLFSDDELSEWTFPLEGSEGRDELTELMCEFRDSGRNTDKIPYWSWYCATLPPNNKHVVYSHEQNHCEAELASHWDVDGFLRNAKPEQDLNPFRINIFDPAWYHCSLSGESIRSAHSVRLVQTNNMNYYYDMVTMLLGLNRLILLRPDIEWVTPNGCEHFAELTIPLLRNSWDELTEVNQFLYPEDNLPSTSLNEVKIEIGIITDEKVHVLELVQDGVAQTEPTKKIGLMSKLRELIRL